MRSRCIHGLLFALALPFMREKAPASLTSASLPRCWLQAADGPEQQTSSHEQTRREQSQAQESSPGSAATLSGPRPRAVRTGPSRMDSHSRGTMGSRQSSMERGRGATVRGATAEVPPLRLGAVGSDDEGALTSNRGRR